MSTNIHSLLKCGRGTRRPLICSSWMQSNVITTHNPSILTSIHSYRSSLFFHYVSSFKQYVRQITYKWMFILGNDESYYINNHLSSLIQQVSHRLGIFTIKEFLEKLKLIVLCYQMSSCFLCQVKCKFLGRRIITISNIRRVKIFLKKRQ